MPLPTPSDVHVDAALTNISIAFMQRSEAFVARQVFPNLPVSKQSDVFYEYSRKDMNRDQAEKRAPGAETAGNGFRVDADSTYYAHVWGFHKMVPDQVLANADEVIRRSNPEDVAARFVTNVLMIRQEAEFVSSYMTGGVWTAGDFDGVATSAGATEAIHWSDQTSGTPIEDIESARKTILEATGYKPNKLVLGYDVWSALKNHPDIIDRIKYSGGVGPNQPAVITRAAMAQVFEVDQIVVSEAIKNTAAENAAEVSSFIVGKDALLVYAAPEPDLLEPTGGYTFSWTEYLGVQNEFGIAISRIPNQDKRAVKIEGEIAMDMKLVSSELGFFWDGIVA